MSDNIAETVNAGRDELEAIDNETKEEKFRRLAIPRVTRALDAVRLIGNLSNKASYSYTDDQVDKIEAALRSSVEETMKLFRGKAKDEGFTL